MEEFSASLDNYFSETTQSASRVYAGNGSINSRLAHFQIKVQGNTAFQAGATNNTIISSIGSNKDIILSPNGIGKIGIGTTSPSSILDVRGADNGTAVLKIYKGSNITAYLGTGSSAEGNEHGYLGLFDNIGNTGI